VTFHAVHAATVPWSILPLGFHAFGMTLATPGLLLTGLDQFPQMRGLAASWDRPLTFLDPATGSGIREQRRLDSHQAQSCCVISDTSNMHRCLVSHARRLNTQFADGRSRI
jgi:hypothetical protein